jgi:hypothetical protein
MLSAIVTGAPGPPPGEYGDLVPALRSYLRHVSRRTGSLHDRRDVVTIRRFLDEPDDVDLAEADRTELLESCNDFIERPHFRATAEQGLLDRDSMTFAAALATARDLDLDVFAALVTRIEGEYDAHPQWYALLEATDEGRIERVLDLGRRFIDLAAIATGPSEAIGLGPGFDHHGQLGWFLRALADYPGRGWDFVATGLASPSIQNRNAAIRVLQEWPRETWPDDVAAALQAAIDVEVVGKVRTFANDVLRGDVPIEESWRRAVLALEDDPELAAAAERLSATGIAMQLRAEGSPVSVVVWNGPYDSQPWGNAHVSVSSGAGGLAVLYRNDAGDVHTVEGLGIDEAVGQAERQVRRLVMG